MDEAVDLGDLRPSEISTENALQMKGKDGRPLEQDETSRETTQNRPITILRGLYGLLAQLTGFGEEPAHGALPPGELRRIALDISVAAKALAWKPWTHLEDGLAETVAYLKGI